MLVAVPPSDTNILLGTATAGFPPETPVWPLCPSYYSVQFYFLRTHPPRSRSLSLESTYSALAHRGRALPPVRWKLSFTVPCLEGNGAWATSQTNAVCFDALLPHGTCGYRWHGCHVCHARGKHGLVEARDPV